MMIRKDVSILFVAFAFALSGLYLIAPGIACAESRHQQWTDLLTRFVTDGIVDYSGFKAAENELDSYLAALGETDPTGYSAEDRLAYYINAYNAYTVKLILDNFKEGRPPSSIRKIGGLFKSPWDIRFAVLGGETYSLDNIEHDIIRKEFTEPRIHFAVNCASKSCPELISEAYEGDTIDMQLQNSTRAFLEDDTHNYLKGGTLYVSSIFKWYKEDFAEGPVSFFIAHVTGELKTSLQAAEGDISVSYVDYDWSLNGKPL